MGKKVDIKTAVADVGKAAAELGAKSKEGIVKALDQDGDGKLDAKDFALVRDQLAEKRTQIRREADRKKLRPIFEEDLDKADFQLSKLIRVAEMDKKHADSEICIGSVGFDAVYKDLRVVNIYPDKTDAFGLSFYPDADNEIYYVDPSDRDYYIALDDYFNYLRVARVSELQRIAQELGAKHFRVTYKEQKKSFTKTDARVKLEAKDATKHGGKAEADHKAEQSSFEKVEIAAEMECIGHKPVAPTLKYFKKDPQIQSLIALRMADNGITHQVYTLVLSNSSGIKVKDAMKIDAALSAMKIYGDATVTSEAQSEARRFFEYEIDF